MEFWHLYLEWLVNFHRRVMHRVEQELERFASALEAWLYALDAKPDRAGWCAAFAAFIAEQEADGFIVQPESVRQLTEWIATWAGDDRPAAQPAVRPHVVTVVPNVSGSPRSKKAGSIKLTTPEPKRLPKEGTWLSGTRGEGILRLERPIKLPDGQIVEEVPFVGGRPIFDKWQLPDGDVTVAITGENRFDQGQAKKVWEASKKKNLGSDLVFHHDGNLADITTYKGKKIFGARMQVIPRALNDAVPHIGSASTARMHALDRALAEEANDLAIKGKGPLIAVAKRLTNRRGRILKLVTKAPLIKGIFLLIDTAQNVEAHGVGGAVVRATPLLGDIVSAYDMGTELANEIDRLAQENLAEAYRRINEPVAIAHEAAQRATLEAFNKVAARIRVADAYIQPDDVIARIEGPLREFHEKMLLIELRSIQREIEYPEGTTAEQAQAESPVELRVRQATEQLERQLRDQFEELEPDA